MNNLDMMQKRLETQGGARQEDRMITDKYNTFLRTLKYSYQGCNVTMAQKNGNDYSLSYCLAIDNEGEIENLVGTFPTYRALMNPDKVKQDYDEKVLSIDYKADYHPGDIFKWDGINIDSYWIIYLQELTEDSYFRGAVRRCKYQIQFQDEFGNKWATWAAIRGPVETQIDSIQKNQIRVDRPNLSLNILLPRNPQTIKIFDRYKLFMLEGKCWRVEAPDIISMDGIIEVNAEEYFKDKDTDTDEIVDGLPEIKQVVSDGIVGEKYIKPKISEIYNAPESGGCWSIVETSAPVRIAPREGKAVEVTWTKTTKGTFTLRWKKGDLELRKDIIVESLL